MNIFSKINQRILMMGRRRETSDGLPGLPASMQVDLFGNLYVSLAPSLPPGADPGNYLAVDLYDTQLTLPDPAYAFPVAGFNYGYRGETVDANARMEQLQTVASPAAANALASGTLAVAKPSQWSVVDTEAANTQASATRAAQGAATRNIVQGATFTMSGTAASFQDITVRIRNGAGGTILWESYIFKGAGQSSVTIDLRDVSLPCSVNTAAVAEFSAAGGDASTFESVTVWGITVS